MSSQGPREGGGGCSMSLTHSRRRDSCCPLASTISTGPSENTAQPAALPNHVCTIQPSSAKKPSNTRVRVMVAGFQRGRYEKRYTKLWLTGRCAGRHGTGLRLPPASSLPGRPAGKAIPRAAHCFDVVLVATRFQCLAQAPDMHIDGTLFDENVVAPDLIEQLGA